jgi:hypothetical protein
MVGFFFLDSLSYAALPKSALLTSDLSGISEITNKWIFENAIPFADSRPNVIGRKPLCDQSLAMGEANASQIPRSPAAS